ncbi:MAG: hypothetical protein LBD50_02280 [Rickettsiales bacterium]|jgi:hypothetical protein|nr:hypothetical protein [Rickettsiales bacterium]
MNLYHGSGYKLNSGDFLELSKSFAMATNPATGKYEMAIYATSNLEYATFYALNSVGNKDSFMFNKLTETGTYRYVFIMSELSVSYSYIYELDSDDFHFLKSFGKIGGAPKDEYAAFKNIPVKNVCLLNYKTLLQMGYDVHIAKKDSFREAVKNINENLSINQQTQNPDKITRILEEYAFDAKYF